MLMHCSVYFHEVKISNCGMCKRSGLVKTYCYRTSKYLIFPRVPRLLHVTVYISGYIHVISFLFSQTDNAHYTQEESNLTAV